jgi:hypothetical protein
MGGGGGGGAGKDLEKAIVKYTSPFYQTKENIKRPPRLYGLKYLHPPSFFSLPQINILYVFHIKRLMNIRYELNIQYIKRIITISTLILLIYYIYSDSII